MTFFKTMRWPEQLQDFRGIILLTAGLFAAFTSLFLFNLYSGWITPDRLERWFTELQARPEARLWLALAVIAVLSIDSVLTVPTLTTVALAGYCLGPLTGGLCASVGMLLAGSICYYGARWSNRSQSNSSTGPNEKDEKADGIFQKILSGSEVERLAEWFHRSGGLALILSRALPMFPEVLSCLAGVSRLPAARFYLYYGLGTVPYGFLVAYAGSASSRANPWPVLAIGLGIPAMAYLVYYLRGLRSSRRSVHSGISPQRKSAPPPGAR